MKTSILIDTSIRDKLRKMGRKQQTYNDIIKQLLEKSNNCPVN